MKTEYLEMVGNLIKDPTDILATLTEDQVNQWHLATGLCGEVSEAMEVMCTGGDWEDLVKELGDIEFYFNALTLAAGMDSTQKYPAQGYPERFSSIMCVSVMAGKYLDYIKKYVVHNRELDAGKIVSMLTDIGSAMSNLYNIMGLPREEALANNTKKLTARYPSGGYSDADAEARVDVT